MNICIPVDEDQGLQSPVCSHFGAAPAFMIVGIDSGSCRAIPNGNQHHGHGTCMPLASLQGERIDAMIVGRIGMGALSKLNAAKVSVYISEAGTVGEVVTAFKAGALPLMQPNMACAQHGQGHP